MKRILYVYYDYILIITGIAFLTAGVIFLILSLMKKKNPVRKIDISLYTSAFIAIVCLIFGLYSSYKEHNSVIRIMPEKILLSENQSINLRIEKILPNGSIKEVDISHVKWSHGAETVLNGGVIYGAKTGETVLSGKYRRKNLTVDITVISKVNNTIEFALGYTGITALETSCIGSDSFSMPESITVADNGCIFTTAHGKLQRNRHNETVTVEFDSGYISPQKTCTYGDDLFILAERWLWEIDNSLAYCILKTKTYLDYINEYEIIYMVDSGLGKILDIKSDNAGNIYLLQENVLLNEAILFRLNTVTKETDIISVFDGGICGFDYNDGYFYLADRNGGVVRLYNSKNNEMRIFAGHESKLSFIDGSAAAFYEPSKIKLYGNYLYILDFGYIRRIKIENATASYTETVADTSGNDFAISSAGELFLCDGTVWRIDP